MITFHLTPYNAPPLNDRVRWGHIEDKRPLTGSGWFEVRIALIRANDGEQTNADFQVSIALLKDKDLRPYLEKAKGKWQIDTSHIDNDDWLKLLKELS